MPMPTVSVHLFRFPYDRLVPVDLGRNGEAQCGDAIVWCPEASRDPEEEAALLLDRRPGLSLIVVLPKPENIAPLATCIRRFNELAPVAVLPALNDLAPGLLRRTLMCVPRRPVEALVDYLSRRGLTRDDRVLGDLISILEASAELRTVAGVARKMATSRRTLGRHMAGAGLPAPSHWLQFARVFRACLLLQSQRATVARVARALGYPDGFTLSNQMKRLIGHRPSIVRERLGWEWIAEAWIQKEALSGGATGSGLLPQAPAAEYSTENQLRAIADRDSSRTRPDG